MKVLAIKDNGSYEARLSSKLIKWANGTEFTEYTVSNLRKDMKEGISESIRHYKKLETAQRNFDKF